MGTKYFENFPIITYEGRKVRDITRRASFIGAVKNNPYVYYPYTVKENERAEDIALAYYGSADYIWLVYMANNIIDPYYEWTMSSQTFNDYLVSKYTEESGRIGEDVIDWTKDTSIDENILYYIKTV
jgi:hypothetical protein